MNFHTATGKTIEEAFTKFHHDNPVVYDYFKRYVQQVLAAGKKVSSSKMIINRIRWEIYIELNSVEDFKINDAFTSRYARLYINEHPQHAEIFNLRELRS